MAEKTAEQVKNAEWATCLLEELQKRTGRHDIEVIVAPSSTHDVLLSAGADKHPIVTFYARMRGEPLRVEQALDYVSEMLKDWDLTNILHEKAIQDCLPIYERLKREFPHMEASYNIIDVGRHNAMVSKADDKIISFFDLWPTMTEEDVKRLISHIKELEDTLQRENATYAEVTYLWR